MRSEWEWFTTPWSAAAQMSWEPIAHDPPLKRIETSPRYTPAPANPLGEEVEQQIERTIRAVQIREGERLWALVVQSATGG